MSNFAKNTVESHFLFFYDLRAKIVVVKDPNLDAGQFEWRKPNDSDLSRYSSSDNFITETFAAHFHGTDQTADLPNYFAELDGAFQWSLEPPGIPDLLPSYHFIECTLFKNGILAVVLRLKNSKILSYGQYVELIARPEHLADSPGASPIVRRPGPLVEAIWTLMPKIEIKLFNFLNHLSIRAITIEDGTEMPLEFSTDTSKRPGETSKIETNGRTILCHRLGRSRPYVGTVAQLKEVNPRDDSTQGLVTSIADEQKSTRERKEREEELQRLAIACARTTPHFLDHFNDPRSYLNEGEPRRNIYLPGPSIVFIGRRGWACLQMEAGDRDRGVVFHLGVVETVLFVIQALSSSVRAVRRFRKELIITGEKEGVGLLAERKISPEKIQNFTNFLAKARLNSPLDDMSTLLRSYLLTHTGIAAVARLRHLHEHEKLLEDTRSTMTNYSSFLQIAN